MTRRPVILGAIVVSLLLPTACTGGGKSHGGATTVAPTTTIALSPGVPFTERPDRRQSDVEAKLGATIPVSGYKAGVADAAFKATLTPSETKGYVVADVTISNETTRAQPYNEFDFTLVPLRGAPIPATSSASALLGSGVLAPAASTTGKVVWPVGTEKGTFYITWSPRVGDPARAVWRVTI